MYVYTNTIKLTRRTNKFLYTSTSKMWNTWRQCHAATLHDVLYLSFLTAVNCGTLTNPANGQVSHAAGTTFGQTAIFSCDTGYNLDGDSNRTCQATGMWSGSSPTCQSMLYQLAAKLECYVVG